MISSTCTAKEATELAKKMSSPAELLRIIDLVQETANGFKSSQNQRLDGELCLIHLCQPDLTNDVRDLAARISRVEDDLTARMMELEHKLKNGNFVVAEPSSGEAPADLDDGQAPPPWDDADAHPENRKRSKKPATPDAHDVWKEDPGKGSAGGGDAVSRLPAKRFFWTAAGRRPVADPA